MGFILFMNLVQMHFRFGMKMENNLKTLQETKNIFEDLNTDTKSILLSEENIDKRLLKKLKKSSYCEEKLFLKLIDLIENDIDQINQTKEIQIPTRLDYVEKREIDSSALYSSDGPFHFIHVDVASLEFLRKLVTTSNYALLIVDFYPSKVFVYPMPSRKQTLQQL